MNTPIITSIPERKYIITATLPVLVIVQPAPANLVDKVIVSTGYLDPVSGEKTPIGVKIFSCSGGELDGSISPTTIQDKFPDKIDVNITVEYTVESGLTPFSQHFDVDVTSSGAMLTWEVPNRLPTTISIEFDFTMFRWNTLDAKWKWQVGGKRIKSNDLKISAVNLGADPYVWKPNPSSIQIVIYEQPGATNQVELSINTPDTFQGKKLKPFEITQALQDSTIRIRYEQIDDQNGQFISAAID